MTDKVDPSFNRAAKSDEVAQIIARAANSKDGFVVPASEVFLADRDADLSTTGLNAFAESHSATSFDVTIDAGEAIINGAWAARDVSTTVTLASGTAGQTVYVGWDTSDTAGAGDTVIIGLDGAFGSADYRIPLWDFDTDGSGVTSATSRRNLGGEVLRAADALISGDELESGRTLTIASDESMVVGSDYTISGDADIQGDLVVVPNQYSHDQLANIDPTDHLEVVKEVQITLTSGSTPAFDGKLSNVFDEQLTAWDVTIAPTNGMTDTYAYNMDTGRQWKNGSWDLPLTVNWDEDPGKDLDLTVSIHRRT